MTVEDNESERLARRWTLVAAHRERLLRVVRSRTAATADAEDVVHEAMVRCVLFDDLDEERVGQFLTTVALRLCADAHRSNGRADRLRARLTGHHLDAESHEDAVCDAAEARAVAAVYETLPARQRSVVAARSEGMSCGQVAHRLGLTYGAVESALVRARAAVRARADVCLEVTTLGASRIVRSLRTVPAEVPAAVVAVAIAGALVTTPVTTTQTPEVAVMVARPVPTVVAQPARPRPALAPRTRVVVRPAPPRVTVVAPARRGGGSGRDSGVKVGDKAGVYNKPTGRNTVERVTDCVNYGVVVALDETIRCREPGENP